MVGAVINRVHAGFIAGQVFLHFLWINRNVSSVKYPLATPDWLVITTTASPARFNWAIASLAPGKRINSSGCEQ